MSNNPSKKFILILPLEESGLFSLFFLVLGYLYLCKKKLRIPLVYFNKKCLYWSPRGFNGSRNVWEYYFKPVSEYGIKDFFSEELETLEGLSVSDFKRINRFSNIYITNKYPKVVPWISPYAVEKKRKFINSLINKHIEIKKNILDKAEIFYEKNIKGFKVVAVHFRGKEKYRGKRADTPEITCSQDYISEIEAYLKRVPDAKFFVATDSEEFLRKLKSMYSDIIIFQDVQRLSENEEISGLHFNEKYQGPKLGEEVLVDALLMSKCDFFIHGTSNVSSFVLFINLALKHINIEADKVDRLGASHFIFYKKEFENYINRNVGKIGIFMKRASPSLYKILKHYFPDKKYKQ